MMWVVFIKTLKNTIQIKNRKYGLFLMICIADMLSNKNLNPIVTELSIRSRNLNISLVFVRNSFFIVPKNIILNSTHYFIMKIPR